MIFSLNVCSVWSVVSGPRLKLRHLFCLYCSNNKQQYMFSLQTCPRSTTTRISVCCFRWTCVNMQRAAPTDSLFLLSFSSSVILINDTQNISYVHFQNLWKMKSESAGENRCLYWALSFVLRSILVTGTECTDVCMYFMLTVSSPSRQSRISVWQSFTWTLESLRNIYL